MSSMTTAALAEYLSERYYAHSSRYTTSALLRMKLDEALANRGLGPHIFETLRKVLLSARPRTSGGAS